MSDRTPTGASHVVDDLYAGTLDDAAWDRALIAVADTVGASAALLLAFNPESGAILREENHRFDESVLNDYRRHWTYQDCRRDPFLSIPPGHAVTELMLDIPNWRRSAILNDFLLPADAPHFMPAWLHKSKLKAVTLSLQGTRKRGPFTLDDLRTFKRLLPHIGRSLEIRDRLERLQIRANALATSLNSVDFGVLVLDSGGRVLEGNSVAQKLLGREPGIRRLPDDTLWLRGPAGGELARWIHSGAPPARNVSGLLHVPRPRGSALSVMASPLPPRNTSWISGDPRWLVLIFDPDRRIHASTELIERDLGLTGREAELVALLVAGYNLEEITRRWQVSQNTARSQLKSVFRKTGARSQSDLIRRVALGPAMRALTDQNGTNAAAEGDVPTTATSCEPIIRGR